MNRRCLVSGVLLCLAANLMARASGVGIVAAPGAELFTNGPVLHFSVQISKAGMESLRIDQRKPVHSTVKEGNVIYEDVAVHVKGAAGSLRDIDDQPALTLTFNK